MKADALPKPGAVEEATLRHHEPHLADVTNVVQRIGIQNDQVGSPAWFDRSHLIFELHYASGSDGSGLNGFEWRQARFHIKLEFAMQCVTRYADVCAGDNRHARSMQSADHFDQNVHHHR